MQMGYTFPDFLNAELNIPRFKSLHLDARSLIKDVHVWSFRRDADGLSGSMSDDRPSIDLIAAIAALQSFAMPRQLTHRISSLESSLAGANRVETVQRIESQGINPTMLKGAVELKRIAGEVNVAIHLLGILASLPFILQPHERIVNLSLGAGNTGRKHDLETDLQIAEFKFINWRGGAEAIRQNSLFVDIFRLAEHDTDRRRVVYLTSLDHPLRFLRGRRSLDSVLSGHSLIAEKLRSVHGSQFTVVSEYWNFPDGRVELANFSLVVPAISDI
jgi:hypothetical protein